MRSLLPYLVVGIADGSIYALAGMGLVLTFKTSGVFNFAHGAQAAAAAFLFFQFRQRLHVPWPVAAVVAVLLAGVVLGLVLERLAAALEGRTLAAKVTMTVGLLVATQAALVLRYGATTLALRPFLPTGLVHLPSVNVSAYQIIDVVLAIVAAAGLMLFFKRTRLGIATQAVVANSELLALQGTSPDRVRRLAWAVGSSFAAVSGLLLASIIGLDASLLTLLVIQAFGAAAIGAFTSLPGTAVGGLVIGVAGSLSTKYLGNTHALRAVPSNVPFLVLFLVLVLAPSRLRNRDLGGVEAPPARPRRLPVRVSATAATAGLAGVVLLPLIVGSRLPVYTDALAFALLFMSVALLVNTSGQVSLCAMAFAAVGASTFARLLGGGVPWLLALLLAGAIAIPVGAIVAIPAIRLSGVYLAIATFGFGILVERIFYPTILMFGAQGVLSPRRPTLPGLGVATDREYYYVALAVLVVACVGVAAVARSRLGRLLVGLSESPATLTAHGVSTTATKVIVFGVSAFLAAVAGALTGPVTGSTSSLSFDFSVSLVLVAVLAICGRRPIAAAFVAAGLYVVAPAYLTSSNAATWVQLVFGLLAIGAAVLPGVDVAGVLGRWRRAKERGDVGPIAARTSARIATPGAEAT